MEVGCAEQVSGVEGTMALKSERALSPWKQAEE